jgi:hypothetical protein
MDACQDKLVKLMLSALADVLEYRSLESRLSQVEGFIDDVEIAKRSSRESDATDTSFDLHLNKLYFLRFQALERM